MEAVGSAGEEGAGMTDFACGQKCALGVSTFDFVLFWSDNGWPSGFFVFVRLTHSVNQHASSQGTFENTKIGKGLTGNCCINVEITLHTFASFFFWTLMLTLCHACCSCLHDICFYF